MIHSYDKLTKFCFTRASRNDMKIDIEFDGHNFLHPKP
jgi:hypothetical protein